MKETHFLHGALTNEHRVTQVRNHAAERLVVWHDDGNAGAVNVNHRHCRGTQGAIMPHGDDILSHDSAMTDGQFLRYALVRGAAVQAGGAFLTMEHKGRLL